MHRTSGFEAALFLSVEEDMLTTSSLPRHANLCRVEDSFNDLSNTELFIFRNVDRGLTDSNTCVDK